MWHEEINAKDYLKEILGRHNDNFQNKMYCLGIKTKHLFQHVFVSFTRTLTSSNNSYLYAISLSFGRELVKKTPTLLKMNVEDHACKGMLLVSVPGYMNPVQIWSPFSLSSL